MRHQGDSRPPEPAGAGGGRSASKAQASTQGEEVKIAYVYDVIYPYVVGGVEKRIWEMGTRLAARGHEVRIFGMKHWEGSSVLRRDGVCLHGVCPPRELFEGARRSIGEAIYFATRVLGPLSGDHFDIIDCQNFPYFPCFSAKLACLLRGSSLVITWHEVWDDYWYSYLGGMGALGKAVERTVSRLTGTMIAVSESTRSGLLKIGVKGNVAVVPNGIDFKAVQAVPPSQEKSDIIFAGRLIREKNLDLLLRSVDLVRREHPDVRCHIIGEGPERERIQRLIEDLRLEENVRLEGFLQMQEEVFARMKASRVFVLPSEREGFGIVAIEANSCGLPVITVTQPQNASCDLIIEGKNGFVCQPAAESIAEKIMAVLADGCLASECESSAQAHDWSNTARMAESVYEQALSARRV